MAGPITIAISQKPGVSPGTNDGDSADGVITGSFTSTNTPGVSAPFLPWGTFNLAIWGSTNTTLTTTANSSAATVASATGLAVGMAINSANVPAGTVIGNLAGTNVTLAFPPGSTQFNVLGGADTAALFTGNANWNATVRLERSFDGGKTWVISGDSSGVNGQAIYNTNNVDVSKLAGEPETSVLYRLNCPTYSSGTVNYRMSLSAGAQRNWMPHGSP